METNEIREKIVSSAQQKMGEVGIRSVSIDDICRELGMSKKTFYVYFATKDELIAAILEAHYEEVRAGMQNFLDTCKSMWAGIQKFAEQMMAMPDVRQFPPFIYDLNKYYPALAKDYNARILALTNVCCSRYWSAVCRKGYSARNWMWRWPHGCWRGCMTIWCTPV